MSSFSCWTQTVVPCPVITVAPDLHTNFSRGRSWGLTSLSHLFQNFPQFIVIHTVKGFGIVNKAEIDVFLELSCFLHDPVDVGNLISAFSQTSLNILKFMVHVLLKPHLGNFEHYFTGVWDECNCAVAWAIRKHNVMKIHAIWLYI